MKKRLCLFTGRMELNYAWKELTTLPPLPEELREFWDETNTRKYYTSDLRWIRACYKKSATYNESSSPDLVWWFDNDRLDHSCIYTRQTLTELSCGDNYLTCLPKLPNCVEKITAWDNCLVSMSALPKKLYRLWCSSNCLAYLPCLPRGLLGSDHCQICPMNFIWHCDHNGYRGVDCEKNVISALRGLCSALLVRWSEDAALGLF